MDVGIWKFGRFLGKGFNHQSQKRNSNNSNDIDNSGNSYNKGYCGHCGKWGHKRADCWSKQKRDTPKGNPKGKGFDE
eukprot:1842529-Amphidinium_carterae.1